MNAASRQRAFTFAVPMLVGIIAAQRAAAHVRTLTIPVFANGVSHDERSGGLLSRWRRGRSDAGAGGCDPAVEPRLNILTRRRDKASKQRVVAGRKGRADDIV